MHGLDDLVIDACRGLAADPSLTSAATLLSRLFGADDVLHTTLDIAGSHADVLRGENATRDDALSESLARYGTTHPAVQSYLAGVAGRRPRRIADIATQRQWLASPAWTEVFRPVRARYQLSMVVQLDERIGRGWVMARSHRDFTDAEVDRATATLPALVALTTQRTAGMSPGETTGSNNRTLLTPRETHVLSLVAAGYTAYSIALRVGSSQATVRKHLQNVYAKIGVSDRLLAVQEARRRGLLYP